MIRLNQLKKTVKSLVENKDNRILIQNFIYLSLMQIAGFIFPLFTLPYLAKVVGANGFGRIAFASAIIVWIQTIADWGFNYTATRDVAQKREDKLAVSMIFSKIFWSRCVLMFISLLLLFVLIAIIPDFRRNYTIILITFLLIPGNIMFSEWFFQAMERMKYITILNFIAKLLFTILVFFFVRDKNDYYLQPLFISLGFITSGFIALYFILVRWKVKLFRPSYNEIWYTIKESTNVFINNLMPNLYNSMSTILLGFFSNPMAVGIYSSGKNFVSISYSMTSIISRTFFPYLVRKSNKHGIFVRISIIVSSLVTIILFLFANFIIQLFYTEEFVDSILVLKITSFALLFITLNTVYGTNYLLIHNYDRLLRNITIISSLIGLILAFPLIYFFDYIGASITFLLSSVLMGGLSTYYAIKIEKGLYKFKD